MLHTLIVLDNGLYRSLKQRIHKRERGQLVAHIAAARARGTLDTVQRRLARAQRTLGGVNVSLRCGQRAELVTQLQDGARLDRGQPRAACALARIAASAEAVSRITPPPSTWRRRRG